MKLSPSQFEVLRQLASCDEPLVYFKGGWWTLPSLGHAFITGSHKQAGRLTWYTVIGTVRSLERLGLLTQTGVSTNYDIRLYPELSDRVLTPKGFALITESGV